MRRKNRTIFLVEDERRPHDVRTILITQFDKETGTVKYYLLQMYSCSCGGKRAYYYVSTIIRTDGQLTYCIKTELS